MNSVITFLRNNYQFILGLVALGTVIVGGGTFVWNKIDSRYIRTDDFNHTQSETNNIITFIYAKETRCLFLESKWTDIYNFQLKRHPNGKILYRDLPPETAEQVRTLKQHIDFLRKDIEEDQEAFKMYCEKNNQSFRTIYYRKLY